MGKLSKAVINLRMSPTGYIMARFSDNDAAGRVFGAVIPMPRYRSFDAAKQYLQHRYQHVAEKLDFHFDA